MIKSFKKDNLKINIFKTRAEMGKAAAEDIAVCIERLLEQKESINMVFAAAPSQNDMLENLIKHTVRWDRINAFHMDEYEGLTKEDKASFGNYLNEHIFGKVKFKNVYYVADYGLQYEKMLKENRIDIVCLGIGENGHIAFNDPGVADFNDSQKIKMVRLDNICRMQQVHDGCFENLDSVPEYAYTLTVPEMVSADYMFCVVPATTKAQAVFDTVNDKIDENCPATIMRRHKNAIMYCDADSGEKIL